MPLAGLLFPHAILKFPIIHSTHHYVCWAARHYSVMIHNSQMSKSKSIFKIGAELISK